MRSIQQSLAVVAAMACLAASAAAALDEVGDVWPNNGAVVGFSTDLDVWVSVTKAGTTDLPGQGAGISGVLRYWIDAAAETREVPLAYVQDRDAADEYFALIPKGDLDGAAAVRVDTIFTDETDGSTLGAQNDQAGNEPPLIYSVDGISQDVILCFQACLENVPNTGSVCISGWPHELTCWISGIEMVPLSASLWQACILFRRGSLRRVEYQYRKDDWTTWETIPTRIFTLDDRQYEMTLMDIWNDGTASCEVVAAPATSWGSVKARFGN